MSARNIWVFCGIIVTIAIYWPTRHARHYDYIDLKDVYKELQFTQKISHLRNCNYKEVILNNTDVEIGEAKSYFTPEHGGVYKPKHCNPLIKVAVIVPYRNRTLQLETFLNYMHNFLQKQYLFYRIFIVDQVDNLAFNRAKMLNFGAKVAIDMDFPCLILHDVDLLPLNSGNIYGCVSKPRHMSSSVDTFRFNLPYLTLFGGVVAISSQHFQKINGLSNHFYGWGGEDDDFYKRLNVNDLSPCRFTPVLSRYTMLFHKKEKASPNRYDIMEKSAVLHKSDGLSTLPSNYSIKMEKLYTLILAS
ncbi:beta-1,4-galactosyltransferase 1 isoform X1 [Tribolium madens]|uniref:beta-1,4-galactosyltransferase 1 isoform X1 n=1 Tax=Tribolium madens TaxID=41895 RepID=UPI001CF75424|nr:beta-1,4-galactosyltransferase 1 isoform X1 [Tribolium madens]